MADTQLKTKILLRNDLATAWTTANPTLLKGEIGIEIDTNKFKIGDGTKKWNEWSYVGTQVEVTGEGEVITGASVSANGTLTLTRGKLYLDDVLLEAPLTYTAPIGVKTVPSSGSGKIGQRVEEGEKVTLLDALNEILAVAKDPTVTNPSVSISLTDAGAKEVGEEFTPSYSVSFNAGSYQYGPATGITATYSVTDTASHTATAASGSFDAFTVADNTNYKVSVTATHTAGAVPKNNLGSEVPVKKIAAGTKSATSSAVTGYRGWFYGYKTGDTALADASAITGAQLRALTKVNGSFPSSLSTNKMKQIFFAAPKGKKASLSITNAVNGAPLTVQKTSVFVEGANNYTAIEYDVFYVSNAVAENGESKWTIK